MDLYQMTLEDGHEYYIIDTILNKENKYLVFNNELGEYTVRKVVLHDQKEMLTKLDNREEYDEVMMLFYQKHKGEK